MAKPYSPAKITVGVNVPSGEASPIYRFIMSALALCGIYGSVFTFLTSCGYFMSFSPAVAIISTLASWWVFSFIFGMWDRKPMLSRSLLLASSLVIFFYVLFNRDMVIAGYMYAVNDFMGSLFKKFAEAPIFAPNEIYENMWLKCLDSALAVTVSIISLLVCRSVKRPNIILFLLATVPLPELCLYFGLVPDTVPFAVLIAAQCGAMAAEIARLSMWEQSAERLCAGTAAQSALCGMIILTLCFGGAGLYMKATGYTRPDKADEFRDRFSIYMKNFSWEKLSDDVHDALIPVKSKNVTHDGRLGNTDKVEFTGENVLEVTLPSDAAELYLKGFTATDYTGSRWNAGPALPQLETKLTSPEFFSGRALKYVDGLGDLELRDVIVRTSDSSDTVKYLPNNSAGLLETNGIRRRFGVYFPQNRAYYNNGKYIIDNPDSISLNDKMARDQERMRNYAYAHCLDVPDTFTAAEDFFADFEGGSTWDTLEFIRKKLADTCEYDLESGKKPFGTDFVQWFLTENKKGSCTHFASAAALLCRYMGIPARYCEGFVIKGSDIAMFPSEGRYTTVSVPDSRAHAWVEIYADGFGWIVFETTPGYGNMVFSENAEDYANPEEVSEITSVTTQAPVFTENPDLTTATETVQMIEGSDTAPAQEGTSAKSLEYSENGSENADNTSSQDGDNNGNNGTFPHGTGDNGGGNGGNTDVAGEEQTGEGSIQSEYDINGVGISSDDSTEETTSSDGEIQQAEKKPMPKAVKILLTVLLWAAIIVGAGFALRYAELMRRKKLAENAPEKAAAEIYRMLARLAAMQGICVSAEKLPEQLKTDFGIECGDIVSAALRARFGQNGSVSAKDAAVSAKQYRTAAEKLISGLSAEKTVLAKIIMLDRYSK